MLSFHSSLDFLSFFRVYYQNTVHIYNPPYAYYEGYPEIEDTKWVDKKDNHCCEGGPQPRPLSQRFSFVFAYKETSGEPEVSRRWRGEKWSHYMVACTGSRVLWHQNTKTRNQAKQMPWQML